MSDMTALTAEELEFAYRQQLCAHHDSATSDYLRLRAEILRRLKLAQSAAPVEEVAREMGQGVGPRCPFCYGPVTFGRPGKFDQSDVVFIVECKKCAPTFWGIRTWDHIAQFFSPVLSPESATKEKK